MDEHNVDMLVEFMDLLDEHGLRNKIDSIDFSPVIPGQAGKCKLFKGKKTYAQYYTDILHRIAKIIEYASSKRF
ncbi:MAG: hypothetical protein QXV99_03905 [Desulfurococcaceae archaeon]